MRHTISTGIGENPLPTAYEVPTGTVFKYLNGYPASENVYMKLDSDRAVQLNTGLVYPISPETRAKVVAAKKGTMVQILVDA